MDSSQGDDINPTSKRTEIVLSIASTFSEHVTTTFLLYLQHLSALVGALPAEVLASVDLTLLFLSSHDTIPTLSMIGDITHTIPISNVTGDITDAVQATVADTSTDISLAASKLKSVPSSCNLYWHAVTIPLPSHTMLSALASSFPLFLPPSLSSADLTLALSQAPLPVTLDVPPSSALPPLCGLAPLPSLLASALTPLTDTTLHLPTALYPSLVLLTSVPIDATTGIQLPAPLSPLIIVVLTLSSAITNKSTSLSSLSHFPDSYAYLKARSLAPTTAILAPLTVSALRPPAPPALTAAAPVSAASLALPLGVLLSIPALLASLTTIHSASLSRTCAHASATDVSAASAHSLSSSPAHAHSPHPLSPSTSPPAHANEHARSPQLSERRHGLCFPLQSHAWAQAWQTQRADSAAGAPLPCAGHAGVRAGGLEAPREAGVPEPRRCGAWLQREGVSVRLPLARSRLRAAMRGYVVDGARVMAAPAATGTQASAQPNTASVVADSACAQDTIADAVVARASEDVPVDAAQGESAEMNDSSTHTNSTPALAGTTDAAPKAQDAAPSAQSSARVEVEAAAAVALAEAALRGSCWAAGMEPDEGPVAGGSAVEGVEEGERRKGKKKSAKGKNNKRSYKSTQCLCQMAGSTAGTATDGSSSSAGAAVSWCVCSLRGWLSQWLQHAAEAAVEATELRAARSAAAAAFVTSSSGSTHVPTPTPADSTPVPADLSREGSEWLQPSGSLSQTLSAAPAPATAQNSQYPAQELVRWRAAEEVASHELERVLLLGVSRFEAYLWAVADVPRALWDAATVAVAEQVTIANTTGASTHDGVCGWCECGDVDECMWCALDAVATRARMALVIGTQARTTVQDAPIAVPCLGASAVLALVLLSTWATLAAALLAAHAASHLDCACRAGLASARAVTDSPSTATRAPSGALLVAAAAPALTRAHALHTLCLPPYVYDPSTEDDADAEPPLPPFSTHTPHVAHVASASSTPALTIAHSLGPRFLRHALLPLHSLLTALDCARMCIVAACRGVAAAGTVVALDAAPAPAPVDAAETMADGEDVSSPVPQLQCALLVTPALMSTACALASKTIFSSSFLSQLTSLSSSTSPSAATTRPLLALLAAALTLVTHGKKPLMSLPFSATLPAPSPLLVSKFSATLRLALMKMPGASLATLLAGALMPFADEYEWLRVLADASDVHITKPHAVTVLLTATGLATDPPPLLAAPLSQAPLPLPCPLSLSFAPVAAGSSRASPRSISLTVSNGAHPLPRTALRSAHTLSYALHMASPTSDPSPASLILEETHFGSHAVSTPLSTTSSPAPYTPLASATWLPAAPSVSVMAREFMYDVAPSPLRLQYLHTHTQDDARDAREISTANRRLSTSPSPLLRTPKPFSRAAVWRADDSRDAVGARRVLQGDMCHTAVMSDMWEGEVQSMLADELPAHRTGHEAGGDTPHDWDVESQDYAYERASAQRDSWTDEGWSSEREQSHSRSRSRTARSREDVDQAGVAPFLSFHDAGRRSHRTASASSSGVFATLNNSAAVRVHTDTSTRVNAKLVARGMATASRNTTISDTTATLASMPPRALPTGRGALSVAVCSQHIASTAARLTSSRSSSSRAAHTALSAALNVASTSKSSRNRIIASTSRSRSQSMALAAVAASASRRHGPSSVSSTAVKPADDTAAVRPPVRAPPVPVSGDSTSEFTHGMVATTAAARALINTLDPTILRGEPPTHSACAPPDIAATGPERSHSEAPSTRKRKAPPQLLMVSATPTSAPARASKKGRSARHNGTMTTAQDRAVEGAVEHVDEPIAHLVQSSHLVSSRVPASSVLIPASPARTKAGSLRTNVLSVAAAAAPTPRSPQASLNKHSRSASRTSSSLRVPFTPQPKSGSSTRTSTAPVTPSPRKASEREYVKSPFADIPLRGSTVRKSDAPSPAHQVSSHTSSYPVRTNAPMRSPVRTSRKTTPQATPQPVVSSARRLLVESTPQPTVLKSASAQIEVDSRAASTRPIVVAHAKSLPTSAHPQPIIVGNDRVVPMKPNQYVHLQDPSLQSHTRAVPLRNRTLQVSQGLSRGTTLMTRGNGLAALREKVKVSTSEKNHGSSTADEEDVFAVPL